MSPCNYLKKENKLIAQIENVPWQLPGSIKNKRIGALTSSEKHTYLDDDLQLLKKSV